MCRLQPPASLGLQSRDAGAFGAEQSLRLLWVISGVLLTTRCYGNTVAFLSRCNKCLGNPRPVEKHLYGARSSSADAEGTVTDVTEKLMLEIVKAF